MKCSVKGCRSYTNDRRIINGIKLSFHSFPSDTSLKMQWAISLKRENWTPTKHSKICSLHFDENDFLLTKQGLKKVKEGAIPKILQEDAIPSISQDQQIRNPVTKPYNCQDLLEHIEPTDTLKERILKEEITRLRLMDKRRTLQIRILNQKIRHLIKKCKYDDTLESLLSEFKKTLNDENEDM